MHTSFRNHCLFRVSNDIPLFYYWSVHLKKNFSLMELQQAPLMTLIKTPTNIITLYRRKCLDIMLLNNVIQ